MIASTISLSLKGRGKVRVIKEGFQGFSRGRIPLEYLVGKTR